MADINSHIDHVASARARRGTVSTSTPVSSDVSPKARESDDVTGDRDLSADFEGPRTAWLVLDEASQSLLRAESIVALLATDNEASAHRSYAGEVASDLLRTVAARLSEAQELVRQAHTESWRSARTQGARTSPGELVQGLRQRMLQLEAALTEPSALDRSLVDAAEGCMLLAKHALDHAYRCLQATPLRAP
jgi:hypothetical protein